MAVTSTEPNSWWRHLSLTAFVAALLMAALAVPLVISTLGGFGERGAGDAGSPVLYVSAPLEGQDAGISSAALEEIRGLAGVSEVAVDLRANISAADEGTWDATMFATRPWLMPPGVQAGELTGNDVVLPEELGGTDMTAYVGKDLSIGYTRGTSKNEATIAEGVVHVVGTYPASWTGYAPRAVLAHADFVAEIFGARYGLSAEEVMDREGVPGAWVQVNPADSAAVEAALTDLGYDVDRDQVRPLFQQVASLPPGLAGVTVLMAALLATQIFQVVRASIAGRAKDFDLLRMRGHDTADIRKLVTRDAVSSVTAGTLIGVVVGAVIAWPLTKLIMPAELALASAPVLPIIGCLLAIAAGLALFAALAAFLSAGWITRGARVALHSGGAMLSPRRK